MAEKSKEEPESKKPREQSAGELVANIVDSIREIGVDFFGSMIPGILFVIGAILIIGVPFILFWTTADSIVSPNESPIARQALLSIIYDTHFSIFIAISSIIFYVIGFLFYRRDPKEPDKDSWHFISKKFESENSGDIDNWVARSREECEYPYQNLWQYYTKRNLDYLASMVNWGFVKNKIPPEPGRSKYFINALKIRIGTEDPKCLNMIVKNEAHVRLISSTWYLLRALKLLVYISYFILISSLIIASLSLFYFKEYLDWDALIKVKIFKYINFSVFYLLIVGFIHFLIIRTHNSIKQFFHYQRVREIFFVLETAHNLFRDKPDRIRDLCPDYDPDANKKKIEKKKKLEALENELKAIEKRTGFKKVHRFKIDQ